MDMDSADDDWKNLKDTQYDPVPGLPTQKDGSPIDKVGCLYFSAFALAFLVLLIKLFVDDPPKSFKEFIFGLPDLLVLVFFFPAGLAPLFAFFLPKSFEFGAFLPIGWIIYIAHGIAIACSKNRKTIRMLLIMLIILLFIRPVL